MSPEPLMTDAVARLRRWAAERADATLLRTRDRTYTYADVEARATRVAAALRAAAGRRGARVALVLEEYDQFFVVHARRVAGRPGGRAAQHEPPAGRRRLAGRQVAAGRDRAARTTRPARPPEDGPVRLVVTADAGGLVDGVRAAGGEAAPAAPADELEAVREDELAMIMFTSGHDRPAQGRLPDPARRLQQRRPRGARRSGSRPDDRIFINTPPYFTSGICHFLTLLANGGGVAGQLGFYFGTGLLDEMEARGLHRLRRRAGAPGARGRADGGAARAPVPLLGEQRRPPAAAGDREVPPRAARRATSSTCTGSPR